MAVIIHCRALIVETQSGFKQKFSKLQRRLAIDSCTHCGDCKFIVNQQCRVAKFKMIVAPCKMKESIISTLHYKILDAILLKQHRCTHLQMLIKSHSSHNPTEPIFLYRLCYKFLSKRVLSLILPH